MPRELPTGTVTFLFTDVEGSTQLLHELGAERYGTALAEHRRVLRAAFAANGGVEVDTQGDAFFVAFPTAPGALAAAAAATEALEEGSIRVRMGLHTGTPHLTEEGYVGADVHLGARIAASGHGGQVLLSRDTRDRLDPSNSLLLDLGEHRLKDFAEPVWIYQLGSQRFPPLKTISNTNLPRPASTFVGREREVEQVQALLRDARLVTLSGPGGSGKTRLALEACAELVPEFRNGTFWVGLAALRDAGLVREEIAQTLGATDGLAEHIGERELLLLLDNFEQVVEAAPELASLVETCPNLRVLVTSRELLRVRGEVEYEVPPLAEPEAVRLFCERARLEPSDEVVELCRRLDSLPLAVELAAARTSVLEPAEILERLEKRLDLLKGGRDAEVRQQTLRATIEWSHELLDEEERRLFARLAVFAGGCTLAAAEEVCEVELDVLQSLVDKSLVRHSAGRFWMLETIREFAREKLEESGEGEHLRRRHAERFLMLAEEAEPYLLEEGVAADWHGGSSWLDRLEAEVDNLRAALDWAESTGDKELAQRLAGALSEFWCGKEHVPEGQRRLELALQGGVPATPARAKALVGAAHMARDSGDFSIARARAQEALELYRQLGDARGMAHSTLWLGSAVADDRDFETARELFEDSGRRFRELGDEHNALFARRMVAWMFYELGDRKRARALHEENLLRARAIGNRGLEATTLGALASYAAEEGRVSDALRLAPETLRIYHETGSRQGVAQQLCRCADALAVAGREAIATRLLACAEALHEELGTRLLPHLVVENERTLAATRRQLGDAAFAEAWEQGRALTADQAVALAFESSAAASAAPHAGT
jgi:predicted ATPase/class 3 adenylate cyclase